MTQKKTNHTWLWRTIDYLDRPDVFRAVMLISLMVILLLLSTHVLAATAKTEDATWGALLTTVQKWFTGDPGIIVSLLALASGVLGAIATSHKATSIILGIGIPIAINVGPSLFQGLSGAVC